MEKSRASFWEPKKALGFQNLSWRTLFDFSHTFVDWSRCPWHFFQMFFFGGGILWTTIFHSFVGDPFFLFYIYHLTTVRVDLGWRILHIFLAKSSINSSVLCWRNTWRFVKKNKSPSQKSDRKGVDISPQPPQQKSHSQEGQSVSHVTSHPICRLACRCSTCCCAATIGRSQFAPWLV